AEICNQTAPPVFRGIPYTSDIVGGKELEVSVSKPLTYSPKLEGTLKSRLPAGTTGYMVCQQAADVSFEARQTGHQDPAVVIREETFFGRVCLVDAGFWGRIDAIQPAPDARWYPPRRHNWSSARSWW